MNAPESLVNDYGTAHWWITQWTPLIIIMIIAGLIMYAVFRHTGDLVDQMVDDDMSFWWYIKSSFNRNILSK